MKLKQIIAGVLAPAIVLTSGVTTNAYAEQTFATPASFIRDVLAVSCADVSSASVDTAVESVVSQLSYNEGLISYKGTDLGYWYSDDSATLYTDSSRSEAIIEESLTGYTIDPDVLSLLITDVNTSISETYTPTTDDWSKIVGKYDITLGDVTIPANQWVELESAETVSSIAEVPNSNLSRISGINGTNIGGYSEDNNLMVVAWLIDNNGDLYISNSSIALATFNGVWASLQMTQTLRYGWSWGTTSTTTQPNIRVSLAARLSSSELPDSKVNMYPICWLTDNTNANVLAIDFNAYLNGYKSDAGILYNVEDGGVQNTCTIADAKATGYLYITGSQLNTASAEEIHARFKSMLNGASASKQAIGDSNLSKRIPKLASLSATDTLTVTPTGWFINDTTSIDSFIASQQMLTAGDTADINAVAEVEPLCFNVVIPTTLPIYISAEGEVSTASNAIVENKSNAAVKITGVNIEAKPESGWTLVASNPSDVRDAKEFSFTTSLAADDIILRGAEHPFTYSAALSPMTAGIESLDLATVSVTVDWAD